MVEPEIRLSLDELFDEYFRAEEKGMRPIAFRNKMRSMKIFFERVDKATDVSEFGKSDASAFIAELDAIYSEGPGRASFGTFRESSLGASRTSCSSGTRFRG